MSNLFGKDKQKNVNEKRIRENSNKDSEIIHAHNNVTGKILFLAFIIAGIFIYHLFQDRSRVFYCDTTQNNCEIRIESNLGYKKTIDLYPPEDINDIIVKTTKSKRKYFLNKSGEYDRVCKLYVVGKENNKINIYKIKNAYIQDKRKLECHAKKIKKLLEEENDVIEYEILQPCK